MLAAATRHEIFTRVREFFDHDGKAALWMGTPNPLLGDVSPNDMLAAGREEKLLRFVVGALAENEHPTSAQNVESRLQALEQWTLRHELNGEGLCKHGRGGGRCRQCLGAPPDPSSPGACRNCGGELVPRGGGWLGCLSCRASTRAPDLRTPGQVAYAAHGGGVWWGQLEQGSRDYWERIAAAVLALAGKQVTERS